VKREEEERSLLAGEERERERESKRRGRINGDACGGLVDTCGSMRRRPRMRMMRYGSSIEWSERQEEEQQERETP
jgi:hypothetical protein